MSEKNQGRISKILLAIDRSGYREKATAYALALARSLGSEVVVVHVIAKSSFGATGDVLGYYRGGKLKAYQEGLKKDAEKLLGSVVRQGEEKGVRISSEVLTGSSAEKAIIDYAGKKKVDLVVIGTKGMTGIERFLMGSVANRVVTYAPCPVLAVR